MYGGVGVGAIVLITPGGFETLFIAGLIIIMSFQDRYIGSRCELFFWNIIFYA